MNSSDRMADISPVRLGLDNKFKFKCHNGVTCFTKCCRGINIILTPYDIIRLKKRLQLSSEEYNKNYEISLPAVVPSKFDPFHSANFS